ncbi:nucleotide exchange factor GrpE [Candidatus Desantisbacteria bacterium]|nr:nucleotide exchange factor GrpE [Candidatus Desantisbacteria bacterium]
MTNKHHHNNTQENKDFGHPNAQESVENTADKNEEEKIGENIKLSYIEKINELEKKIKEKESEISNLKDKDLRLHAEFDNFRKRTIREKEELSQYAHEKLIEQMLPILEEQNQKFKNFIDGINMSYKSLKNVFEKEGLKEIDTCGQSFNPAIHEAIQIVECQDHPDENIIEQIQKGYCLGNRILRHPKVKVAKNINNNIDIKETEEESSSSDIDKSVS